MGTLSVLPKALAGSWCESPALRWWPGCPTAQEPAPAPGCLVPDPTATLFAGAGGLFVMLAGKRSRLVGRSQKAYSGAPSYKMESVNGVESKHAEVAVLNKFGSGANSEPMDIGATSITGRKGKDSGVNQDCLALHCEGQSLQVAVVADGHGPNGHRVAANVCKTLPSLLLEAAVANDLSEAVTGAFRRTEARLSEAAKEDGFSIHMSGAAAVAALLLPEAGLAYIAGCGDCQAVVLHPSAYNYVVNLPHKPHHVDENKRISRAGGIVQARCLGPDIQSRVYSPANGGGLAMSRSFGDSLLKSCGVICDPDVLKVSLKWPGSCCVLGSDGLFELLTAEEVVRMVREDLPLLGAQMCADRLVAAARQEWLQAGKGSYCDDITCLVLCSHDFAKAAAKTRTLSKATPKLIS